MRHGAVPAEQTGAEIPCAPCSCLLASCWGRAKRRRCKELHGFGQRRALGHLQGSG